MAARVIRSLHNAEVDRCVDIVRHDDGTFGFKEFRRDPEDRGGWTLTRNADRTYSTETEAIAAARTAVAWLREERAAK
jgi:hypothetical protein